MFWTLMKRREDLERARKEGLEEGRRRGREAALEALSAQGLEAKTKIVREADGGAIASGSLGPGLFLPLPAGDWNDANDRERAALLSFALNNPQGIQKKSEEYLELILQSILEKKTFVVQVDSAGDARLVLKTDAESRNE